MSAPRWLDQARIPVRAAGFVGLTFSLYGALEVDTLLAPADRHAEVLHKWMHRYGRGLLRLFGLDVSARGPFVENGERYPGADARGQGRVFVMNHRSALDVFVTLAFVEATIVSRADLARWPVIGVAARRVGTLFVDRSDRQSGGAVVKAMCTALEQGRGVMVYPEGTTFAGDEVRPFRAGAFAAAQRTGAEVVPIGLAYGGDVAYVEESISDHMRRVASAATTRAAIRVGEPIAPGTHANVESLSVAARAAVQALVHAARGDIQL